MNPSYRILVVVEELDQDGEHVKATIASWEVECIRFGNCADAVTHGQKVRKAANKLRPTITRNP